MLRAFLERRALMMNIHLSKPGGQREGPFTLDQINQDLAAHRYHDSDYWAWYEGLNEWVPLHQVPGVIRSSALEPQEIPGFEPQNKRGDTEVIYRKGPTSPDELTPEEEPTLSEGTDSPEGVVAADDAQEEMAPQDEAQEEGIPQEESSPGDEPIPQETSAQEQETASEEGQSFEEESATEVEPSLQEESVLEEEGSSKEEQWQEEGSGEEVIPQEEAFPEEVSKQTEEGAQPVEVPPSLANQLYSGMALEALEQVLLLSSGDAQVASRSAITTGMLEAAAGAGLDVIREKIPRDAMGGCTFLEKVREGGRIPEAALRAAARLKPDLVRQAREGLYRICVRTFPIETGEIVALFLFYNKQML